VCDPIDEPELYLRTAEESGMKIRYVVDTHVHADHVSGGRRLAEMTGAKYVLHASCGAGYEFFPVGDGDNLDLGNVQVRVLHTPGHTPEHISLLVTDKTRGPEQWRSFTPTASATSCSSHVRSPMLQTLPDFVHGTRLAASLNGEKKGFSFSPRWSEDEARRM
jgi:metallo-beta-lactamase superfamily protein